jgi:hypothetical protein
LMSEAPRFQSSRTRRQSQRPWLSRSVLRAARLAPAMVVAHLERWAVSAPFRNPKPDGQLKESSSNRRQQPGSQTIGRTKLSVFEHAERIFGYPTFWSGRAFARCQVSRRFRWRRWSLTCSSVCHRSPAVPPNHTAQQGARANDHGCHDPCSEQHGSRQPRSWLILNVSQK